MKKKKIFILGGSGQMGRIVANALCHRYDVTVGDMVKSAYLEDRVGFSKCNISSVSASERTVRYFKSYDVVVNCLPSALGMRALKLVALSGVDCVDLSFSSKDPFVVDGIAKKNGCCIIPDAGLAPGLTNLWVGKENKKLKPDTITILVGGVSKSPFEPYGYAATWRVEDLLEEYIRPARYRMGGDIFTKDPLESVQEHNINGVKMESFLADGLRTLLRPDLNIFDISERTLRWPGHVAQVAPLIKEGLFVNVIKKKCDSEEDTVVFRIQFYAGCDHLKTVDMICHSSHGKTAMAKTTGYACAVTADMLAQEIYKEPGVHPLEDVGTNKEAFKFIIDELKRHHICFKETKNA